MIFSKQRRLSFEYIVFKGLNDSQVYAKELLKLLRGLDCRINLIRFHAIPGVDLEGADMDTMTRFRDYLTTHGLFYYNPFFARRRYFCSPGMFVDCETGEK